MMATTNRSPFELAEMRVNADDELYALRDIILHYDWAEGDDHYAWVLDAPRDEILAWAREIDENCFPDG